MAITADITSSIASPVAVEDGLGRRARIAGTVLTVAFTAFILFDAVGHILDVEPVRRAMADLGYPAGSAPVIGVLELVSLVLLLVPRTRFVGALLMTAYLGGAMSAQFRVEAPLFSTMLSSVYTAVIMWAALYLRDPRVRALVRR